MNCDMCGKDTQLFIVSIEGAKMQACKDCGKYGKFIGQVKTKEEKVQEDARIKEILERKSKPLTKDFETHETIAANYSQIIRKKREALGMSQEDFAKKLNIKESEIHHLENNQFRPPIDLARKIEKSLGIKLIMDDKVEGKYEKTSSGPMTIGDIFNNIKK